jgi:putative peptidoglycan lipid II flippase
MVAFTLHFFAIGLLSHAIVEIGVRVFFALHDTWTPVVIGVIAMMIDITLSIILSVPLLQGGLALGTSIATTFEMLTLLTLLNRRMKWLNAGVLARSLGRDIAAAAVMAVVVWAGVRWLQSFDELGVMVNVWLQALGGIVLATVSYGIVTLLLGSPEARWLVDLILRRRPA